MDYSDINARTETQDGQTLESLTVPNAAGELDDVLTALIKKNPVLLSFEASPSTADQGTFQHVLGGIIACPPNDSNTLVCSEIVEKAKLQETSAANISEQSGRLVGLLKSNSGLTPKEKVFLCEKIEYMLRNASLDINRHNFSLPMTPDSMGTYNADKGFFTNLKSDTDKVAQALTNSIAKTKAVINEQKPSPASDAEKDSVPLERKKSWVPDFVWTLIAWGFQPSYVSRLPSETQQSLVESRPDRYFKHADEGVQKKMVADNPGKYLRHAHEGVQEDVVIEKPGKYLEHASEGVQEDMVIKNPRECFEHASDDLKKKVCMPKVLRNLNPGQRVALFKLMGPQAMVNKFLRGALQERNCLKYVEEASHDVQVALVKRDPSQYLKYVSDSARETLDRVQAELDRGRAVQTVLSASGAPSAGNKSSPADQNRVQTAEGDHTAEDHSL